jgi:hypothetical protein
LFPPGLNADRAPQLKAGVMRFCHSGFMPILVLICFVLASVPSFSVREESVAVAAPDITWVKFDEYSNIRFAEEKRRLNDFVTQLRGQRTATAYIVGHAGRRSCKGEAQARAERAKKYLIRSGGIEASRIRMIDAGYWEEWTIELYIGPRNAPPLTAEILKTFQSTIPPEQAQIVRNCAGKFSGLH